MYYLDKSNPTSKWKGHARLARYELKRYTTNGTNAQVTEGYTEPFKTSQSGFYQWPYVYNSQEKDASKQITVSTTIPSDASFAGNSAVLVDFVDPQGLVTTNTTTNADTPLKPVCANPNQLVPQETKNGASGFADARGFFACVIGQQLPLLSDPNATETKVNSTNQEVVLFLRGNYGGRPGYSLKEATSKTRLDPIQTRVLVRGVIDKNPSL